MATKVFQVWMVLGRIARLWHERNGSNVGTIDHFDLRGLWSILYVPLKKTWTLSGKVVMFDFSHINTMGGFEGCQTLKVTNIKSHVLPMDSDWCKTENNNCLSDSLMWHISNDAVLRYYDHSRALVNKVGWWNEETSANTKNPSCCRLSWEQTSIAGDPFVKDHFNNLEHFEETSGLDRRLK